MIGELRDNVIEGEAYVRRNGTVVCMNNQTVNFVPATWESGIQAVAVIKEETDPIDWRTEGDSYGHLIMAVRNHYLGDKWSYRKPEGKIAALDELLCHLLDELDDKKKKDLKKIQKAIDLTSDDRLDPNFMIHEKESVLEEFGLLEPVWLMSHSGYACGTGAKPCPWDSAYVGYFYVSYPHHDAYTGDNPEEDIKDKMLKMKARAQHAVQEYSMYLSGQVYEICYMARKEDAEVEYEGGYYGISEARKRAEEILKEVEC